MAARGLLSYWWLPIFSASVWLGMLLGMLLWWVVTVDEKRLKSMEPSMSLPYISDIGAFALKPLFIAGAATTTVSLDLSLAAERWLRHRGRLAPNRSLLEKLLVIGSILFALAGTAGLISLSILDTYTYPTYHDIFLVVFLAGYLLSAVCICWEYQRLGVKYREYRILRESFWVKLTFILVELALAIAFGVLSYTSRENIAAYLEWIIAFIFTGYILSFVIDLWPARTSKSPTQRFSKEHHHRDMEETGSDRSLAHRPGPTGPGANF